LLVNPCTKRQLFQKKDDPSGSRTLLRLHRALEYVVAFLGEVFFRVPFVFYGTHGLPFYDSFVAKYFITVNPLGSVMEPDPDPPGSEIICLSGA
jgi:hypothetical protein